MKKVNQLTQEQEKLFDQHIDYAKQLASRYREHYEDIYSLALLTLFNVVKNWDPSRGIKLKTYFSKSLHNAIADYFTSKIRQEGRSLSTEKALRDRILELEDLYDELKIIPEGADRTKLHDLEDEINNLREKLILVSKPKITPLETNIFENSEGDMNLLEIIEDISEVKVEDISIYNELKNKLKRELNSRDYKILELVEQGYTFEEISKIMQDPKSSEGVRLVLKEKVLPKVKEYFYETI